MSELEEALRKAIILSNFLAIYGNVDDALAAMRHKAEKDDWVAAAYKDQLLHYIDDMLRTPEDGVRWAVISMLRRMGEPEFNMAEKVEATWTKEKLEHPEFVERERAIREFIQEEVKQYCLEQFQSWVGPERFKRVQGIQAKVRGIKVPPKKPEPKKETELERLRKILDEKIEELKGE